MSSPWYSRVAGESPITQGDLIEGCPVLEWKPDSAVYEDDDDLKASCRAIAEDVVVMTQACDLENSTVSNVLLCPVYPMKQYKNAWTVARKEASKGTGKDAWINHVKSVKSGFVWGRTLIAATSEDSGLLVVQFQDVYTIPRSFIDSVVSRQPSRMRLLSPYREHLSQAFARYFMRVGLPVPVE